MSDSEKSKLDKTNETSSRSSSRERDRRGGRRGDAWLSLVWSFLESIYRAGRRALSLRIRCRVRDVAESCDSTCDRSAAARGARIGAVGHLWQGLFTPLTQRKHLFDGKDMTDGNFFCGCIHHDFFNQKTNDLLAFSKA